VRSTTQRTLENRNTIHNLRCHGVLVKLSESG
jgi:hypothetical protein